MRISLDLLLLCKSLEHGSNAEYKPCEEDCKMTSFSRKLGFEYSSFVFEGKFQLDMSC